RKRWSGHSTTPPDACRPARCRPRSCGGPSQGPTCALQSPTGTLIDMQQLRHLIDDAFERRASIDLQNPPAELREAVETAIDLLDRGEARVAEKTADGWIVNQWLKKAVLLHFGIERSVRIDGGFTDFFDKVPLKYRNY